MNNDLPLTFIAGETPAGEAIVSLLVRSRFAVGTAGECELIADDEPCSQLRYYPEAESAEKVQASLLQRDIDLYSWRRFTDVVVQGTARSLTPCQRLPITLECRGNVAGDWTLLASGDRSIDSVAGQLVLSEPETFVELPLRYDRAYGGTDMHAERRLANPDEEAMFELMFSELENRQFGAFSYPRNPSGLGYAVTEETLVGMRWPNIEWQDTPLLLDERLVLAHARWGERPSPAGFDWYPHAWFPRIAFLGDFEPTLNNAAPQLEVDMGLLPAEVRTMTLLERPKHGFGQGSHPYLQGSRLRGDEQLSVNALGVDGSHAKLQLPNRQPHGHIVGPDGKRRAGRGELDLVYWDCEQQRLELLWRISVPVKQYAVMAENWQERCSATIDWNSSAH